MQSISLEFIFRKESSLKDLVSLMNKVAKTLSVRSSKESSTGTTYFITHKKYPGDIQLSESTDGVITGQIDKSNMILGAFVDWIGRNGHHLVYGLNIRFNTSTS